MRSRTIYPQNILATDFASPLATPYSDGLIQFIHLAENTSPKQMGFARQGIQLAQGEVKPAAALAQRKGKNCAAVEKEIPPSCGQLADQLNHLVQFHWQE